MMKNIILLICLLSLTILTMAQSETHFVTTWQTDLPGATSSTELLIVAPFNSGFNYDIDWDNDGTFDEIGLTSSAIHDYGVAGTYTVRIRGTFPQIHFGSSTERTKLLSVDQWGDQQWISMHKAFEVAENMNVLATDAPDLSIVTDMSEMFSNCTAMNGDISSWDVSNVTNMRRMFWAAESFNQDLDAWDVIRVTNMEEMFITAYAFNGQIGSWDVDSVINMSRMLSSTAFNQNINNWNVSQVIDMSGMFLSAESYNQPMDNWEVGNVTTMFTMFGGCEAFNQEIGGWDVSNVENMSSMFVNNFTFDQNIGSWDVSNVTNMSNMFGSVQLSTPNYDSLLIGWNRLDPGETQIPQNITFHGGNSQFCEGAEARENLMTNNMWVITDGDEDPLCGLSTEDFVTTWQTDLPGATSSTELLIVAPFNSGFNYDIDWDNDGTFDEIGLTSSAIHDYGVAGTYTVRIRGTFPQIHFGSSTERTKLLSVDQWGDQQWISMHKAFEVAENMNVLATDAPDLSIVTDMSEMFSNCTAMNGDISSWDVSNVTNMRRMFWAAESFNQDLDAWDVIRVTNMEEMFITAYAFNGQIGSWDVDSVINMSRMLSSTAFNQNINNWNVSQVIDMSGMFLSAESYNQPMDNWEVGNVTTMFTMFGGCEAFNQEIGGWDVSNVENMSSMFVNNFTFDQNIGSWDVSNVTNMSNMFGSVQLSTPNYDSLLIGWNRLDPGETQIPQNITFHGGNSQFCEGAEARENLMTNNMWSITDGDEDPECALNCYQDDKATLEQFYSSFAGSPVIPGWDFTPGVVLDETWQGISMTDDGGCQVDSLDLNNLGLSGSLVEIGNLQSLRYLRIGNSQFPLGIPSTFENHPSLEYINLTDNEMTGTGIPAFLGTITTLEYLYLGTNDLGGTIPPELGNLTNLKVLDLDRNQLTGEIPAGVFDADMVNMEQIYLYFNASLTGELTNEMGMMENIQVLWLQNNNFIGCIPTSFSNYCGESVNLEVNPQLDNDNFSTFCAGGSGGCPPITCSSDFNEDGTVDGEDFALFLGNFNLPCNPQCSTDINNDNITDGTDFGIFLGNFGLDCE